MLIILLFCLFISFTIVCYAIKKRKSEPAIFAVVFIIAVSISLGYVVGESWEKLRNYDQFIYQFSKYSKHIRALAEQQQLADLTNSVILFDMKFNSRQDAQDLEDVVNRILKEGKYYQETNLNSSMH